jgi:hypothetical protein
MNRALPARPPRPANRALRRAALRARMRPRAIRTPPTLLTRMPTRLRARNCRRPHHLFRCWDCWASAHWFPDWLLAERNNANNRADEKNYPEARFPGSFFVCGKSRSYLIARADQFAVSAAGCCCVAQWIAPRPQIKSPQWMPTTSCCGKMPARIFRALRS